MAEAYVVEYGDETGAQVRRLYPVDAHGSHAADMATLDVLSMLQVMGIDAENTPYRQDTPWSVLYMLSAYTACGIPWQSIYDIGDGDAEPFSFHGSDADAGNWHVSLVMVREA